MGKEAHPGTTEQIFAAPVPNAASVRGASARTLATSSINPVTAGNQVILAKNKRAILYKNGYTLPDKAAALLAAEAVSGIDDSPKLGRNIAKNGKARADETDAHHLLSISSRLVNGLFGYWECPCRSGNGTPPTTPSRP